MMLFTMLMLLGASGPTKVQECQLSVGDVFTCTATGFNGTTPLEERDGRVRNCKVAVGRVVVCTTPYTGSVVLKRGSRYHRCHVTSGVVNRCEATGFTGRAVLRP